MYQIAQIEETDAPSRSSSVFPQGKTYRDEREIEAFWITLRSKASYFPLPSILFRFAESLGVR
ncbi:MAG: hypothetical protein ACLFR1_10390, partial [Spirochaetia bacterium]